MDSQSVRMTGVGEPRGEGGGKQINGRKRHLLVATQGFALRAMFHEVSVADRDGSTLLLPAEAPEDQPSVRGQSLQLAHLWLHGVFPRGEWKGLG